MRIADTPDAKKDALSEVKPAFANNVGAYYKASV